MRKFLMNGAVLSSIFAVVPVIRRTSTSHRRWAVALLWIGWGIGVAVAIAGVLDDADDEHDALES
ncbi:aminoacyl-histidine dipeptidase [Pseudoclavibacter chungangensis]|uniref:Aminoacyl-histidine dipeptidase n=1 Tax=Pseudoclavibacter chungangensis TaxID=587635 RepID=A0A7J5C138_9MICO|nr:aminoacyl-histidine dipeptidase [Pseudoclavibacter chungangensis]KAB1659520.1 aminoacyl-histidine dipeptidase [Pseudoclavibacter chungangensis]NYJ67617.1 hypothetical protein [Pseudoclavibacter chungangensis]